MTILLAFLARAWPYIVGAVLLAGAWYWMEHRCNVACQDARVERDAALESIARAKAAERAIAALYGEQVLATQKAEAQRDGERNARFAPIESAVRQLPPADARLRFPASAARVLDDAIRAGNARLAEPATGPDQEARAVATDTDVASVTAWGVTCAKQYAELVDQVLGWQSFYAGLQHAQTIEQLH